MEYAVVHSRLLVKRGNVSIKNIYCAMENLNEISDETNLANTDSLLKWRDNVIFYYSKVFENCGLSSFESLKAIYI